MSQLIFQDRISLNRYMNMKLDDINQSSDLRWLSISELNNIAQQVRERIIEIVSANGGHLAPSLGAVELTISLLTAFDPPRDKIIWDVGHQCYAYKILTGRKDSFGTLRKTGGISGFPYRRESAYDAFGTGHATTSISAALGYARARDLRGEDYKVVAVIGDGALTGGIAWEAVNNAGEEETDMIVVLNDNGMSISPNVGAFATHINHLRSQSLYQCFEESTEQILEKMKVGGGILKKAGRALSRGITHWVSPKSGTLFESLGFTYIGPVDGHNIRLLRTIFSRIKRLKGPILVHVVTTKGKGYKYAERNARAYHGVGIFNISNGKSEESNGTTYSKVFGDALVQLATDMPDICAITAAMPDGTGLAGFTERFPDRFFNVGIAEEHAVIFAAGLAAGGMKPVVAIYSTFLQRAYDQILHDVCLQQLPVVFAIDRAGIVGQDGATHQGTYDISYLRHIPNLVIMAPRNGTELRSMLRYALQSNKPCAIRYPRDGSPSSIIQETQPLEFGRAEVIKEGNDVVILGLGDVMNRCIEASILLEQQGRSVGVVNARFIKPLDDELIRQLASSASVLVTVEEHVRQGGFGSAVLETLNQQKLPTEHILTIALPDEVIPHGDPEVLRERYGCSALTIAQQINAFMDFRLEVYDFDSREGPCPKPGL
jgi:1-deoxy-D-xylulose-5-phosphate synthase